MRRALLLATAALSLSAQIPSRLFPLLSPEAEVSQTIGVTTVSLTYHRPAVRGRQIWGGLVPYGQVWRMGANEATTLRFSDPVKVDGIDVPAGTYALFAIPGPDSWTLILSRKYQQFGAWEYNPKDDLVRWEVKAKNVNSYAEWLTFEIYPASRSTAYIDLYWERVRISFIVEADVDRIVTERMKKAMAKAPKGDWKFYSDAAAYCADQDTQLQQGVEWADKAIRIQENPTDLFVKARLQRRLGMKDEALKTLARAITLAKARHEGPIVTGPMEQSRDAWAKEN